MINKCERVEADEERIAVRTEEGERQRLFYCLEKIGEVFEAQRKKNEAHQAYRAAANVAREFKRLDPNNACFRFYLAKDAVENRRRLRLPGDHPDVTATLDVAT